MGSEEPVHTDVGYRFSISCEDPTDDRHVLCLVTTKTCPHCPPVIEEYPELQRFISERYSLRFAHIDLDRMSNSYWNDMFLPIPRGLDHYVSWFPSYLILNGQAWNRGAIQPSSLDGFTGDIFGGIYIENRWQYHNMSRPSKENILEWLGDVQKKYHIHFEASHRHVYRHTMKDILKEIPDIYHVFTMSITWVKSETGQFATSPPRYLPSTGARHLFELKGFFHSSQLLSYSDEDLFEFYRCFGLTDYFIPQMTPEYTANLFTRYLDILTDRYLC